MAKPVVVSEGMMRKAASQREVVDLQAEEDIDKLRQQAVRLLRERDSIQEQAYELRILLHQTQVLTSDLTPHDTDSAADLFCYLLLPYDR